MSSKLDQSLEDISKSRRQSGRGNNRRRSGAKPTTPKAPVGGIKKSTKPVRNSPRGPAKGTAIGPTSPVHESKIIVSGLVSLPPCVEDGTSANFHSRTMWAKPVSRYVNREARLGSRRYPLSKPSRCVGFCCDTATSRVTPVPDGCSSPRLSCVIEPCCKESRAPSRLAQCRTMARRWFGWLPGWSYCRRYRMRLKDTARLILPWWILLSVFRLIRASASALVQHTRLLYLKIRPLEYFWHMVGYVAVIWLWAGYEMVIHLTSRAMWICKQQSAICPCFRWRRRRAHQ